MEALLGTTAQQTEAHSWVWKAPSCWQSLFQPAVTRQCDWSGCPAGCVCVEWDYDTAHCCFLSKTRQNNQPTKENNTKKGHSFNHAHVSTLSHHLPLPSPFQPCDAQLEKDVQISVSKSGMRPSKVDYSLAECARTHVLCMSLFDRGAGGCVASYYSFAAAGAGKAGGQSDNSSARKG